MLVFDGCDTVSSSTVFVDVDLSQLFTTFNVASTTGINSNGVHYTKDQTIQLKNIQARSFIAGARVQELRVRNEAPGVWNEDGWVSISPDATQLEWDLTPGDGPKIVAVQAMNDSQVWGPVARQMVMLDNTAPSVPAPKEEKAKGVVAGIHAQWNPAFDGWDQESGVGVRGYDIQYRLDINSPWTDLASNSMEPGASLEGLTGNQKAEFRIRAVDLLGNASLWSEPLNGCSLADRSSIIKATSSEQYDPALGHYVELELAVVKARAYKVYVVNNPGGGTNSEWLTSVYDGASGKFRLVYLDTGLVPKGQYDYRVDTINEHGEVTIGQVQTVALSNKLPPQPMGLSPVGWVHSPALDLLHERVAQDADGDPVAYFYTLWDESNNGVVQRGPSNTVSGLRDGTMYHWFVEAFDGIAYVPSDTVSFRTDFGLPVITLSNTSTEWAQSHAITISATDALSGLARLEYAWNNEAYKLVGGTVAAVTAPQGQNTLHVRAYDVAGNMAEIQQVYRVDQTAPVIQNLRPDAKPFLVHPGQELAGSAQVAITSNSEIFATWEMFDPETSIASYKSGVTEAPGSVDPSLLANGSYVGGINNQAAARGNLLDGHVYYFVVQATNKVGIASEVKSSEPVFVDGSAPVNESFVVDGLADLNGMRYAGDFTRTTPHVVASDPHSGIAGVKYALVDAPFADQQGQQASQVSWVTDWTALSSQPVVDGQAYYFAARVTNGVGLQSLAFVGPVTIDKTPPVILSLSDEGDAKQDGTMLSAVVEAEDPTSGVVELRYAVGMQPGGAEVTAGMPGNQQGWMVINNPRRKMDLVLNGLNLADGAYYFTVVAKNAAGDTTTGYTDGIRIDSTLPPAPAVWDDGAYTPYRDRLHATVVFQDAPGLVANYLYRILAADGSVVVDWKLVGPAGTGLPVEILEAGSDPAVGLGLTDGMTYFFEVKAVYADSTLGESPVTYTNGITVDGSPAQFSALDDGTYVPRNLARVSWQAMDAESGIAGFKYAVGTIRGGTDVTGGYRFVGGAAVVALADLPLQEGRTYYVSVVAINGAGTETMLESDGFTVDSTPPPAPRVLDQGNFTNDGTSLSASWTWTLADPESGTMMYEYAIVPERGTYEDTIWTPVGTATKATAPGLLLANGEVYFFAVRATNGAGLTSIDFSDGIVVDTSAPGTPVVDDGADYTSNKTVLTATVTTADLQSGVDHFTYSLGTFEAPESVVSKRDVTPAAPGTATLEATGLNLVDGAVYFFSASATNSAGLVSPTGMSDGIMVDTAAPGITRVVDDGQFTRVNTELHAAWDVAPSASPIVEYEYAITTDPNETSPAWVSAGTARNVLAKGLALQDGVKYYFLVRARNAAGTYTPLDKLGKTDGIIVDTTAPPSPVVWTEGSYTGPVLRFSWGGSDPHSGVVAWKYAVGTAMGGFDVTGGWVEGPAGVNYVERTGLPLTDKGVYYISVMIQNGAGQWSEAGSSNALVADLTAPTRPVVAYEGGYVRSQTTISGVRWVSQDPETGIAAYRVGVTENQTAVTFGAPLPTESTEVKFDLAGLALTEGQTYYVAVQTQNRVGLWSETGFSGRITVDTTPPVALFPKAGVELVTNTGEVAVPFVSSEAGTAHLWLSRPDGTVGESTALVQAGEQVLNIREDQIGRYRLRVYLTDLAGNVGAEVEQPIRYNSPPQITAGVDFSVRKGQPFQMEAEGYDIDGTLVSFEWDFGDGTSSASGQIVDHLYPLLGSYPITLKVTDNDGGVSIDTVTVTVTNTSAGTLYLDETWSGKMAITGEVIVPAGLTLAITAGTQVTVSPGASLMVRGKLVIAGAAGNEVLFQAADGVLGSWRGIILDHSAQASSIVYATIRQAVRGVAAISSPLTVHNTTFDQNETGLHAYEAAPVVESSAFTNNFHYGIKEDAGGNPVVTDCSFSGNGVAPYYDEEETEISVERLNQLGVNRGNR